MNVITVVVDDKVGILADIAALFAKSKINIHSVDADVVAGKGLISLELAEADLEKGRRLLEGSGYKTEKADSVIIKLTDRPGELSRITALLSKEGISIDSVHTISRDGKNTLLSLRTSKPRMASAILKEYLVVSE